MEQFFAHGFFHADSHPGNIFELDGNVICYLDFGVMGRLDLEARGSFASLIIGSALMVLSGIPPEWHEMPIVGLVGFLLAGVMGFWLLVSIIRGGRM